MTTADAEHLRRELMLRAMFPAMTRDAVVRFAELVQPLSVKAGSTIFEAGSAADTVFFVLEGRVVMQGKEEGAWSFGPRSVVGVIDAMIGRPRARSCVATEDSQLLTLPVSEWIDLLEEDSDNARGSIRNFAQQLHTRWQGWASSLPAVGTPDSAEAPRAALSTFDKIVELRRAAFLKSAGMQAIASLAAVAEEVRLQADQILYSAGASSEALHVVVSGRIVLTSEANSRIVQTSGELVGGPAALSGSPAIYTARALTPAVLLKLSEHDYYDHVEEHVRLARGTLAYLVTEFERVLKLDPPRA